MSQRLLRIEADVHQLKEVLFHTPSSSLQTDDAKKGGDTDTDDNADDDDNADNDDNVDDDDNADDDPKERDIEHVDNTFVQTESPKPMHLRSLIVQQLLKSLLNIVSMMMNKTMNVKY
uniref:Uncharacterized protein n=1 Tax=Lactuca sativa TaxID=4236 RepID=A0A9R1UXR7_LACSA|nr:hypothetical protein LSAT_V11C700384090 [Lactuca sativa]